MNFGSVMIKALVVLVLLYLLSLANAITFPFTTIFTAGAAAGLTSILLFLLAIVLLALFGTMIAKGIKSVKKSGEALLLAFVGSFFMGAVLTIFTILQIPYTITVHLSWAGGTNWYNSLLTLFFIGIPLMLTFLVGD
jgi:hypothetical protein